MANNNLDILKYIEEQKKKQEQLNKQTSSSQKKTATSFVNNDLKKVDSIGSGADYLLKSGYVGLANNIDSLGGGVFKTAGNLGQTTNDILDKIASDNIYEAYRDRTKEDFDYDITDEQLAFLNDAYRKHREQYLKDYDYNNPTNIAETILGQDRVNKIIDKVDNNKVANFLDEAGDFYFDRANNRTTGYETPDNFLLKTAGDVASGIGGMVPSIAASLATGNPTAGLAVMGTGAYGSGMNEALQDGSNLGDAALYGLANAATEVATEKLTGGLDYFGKGTLDDITEGLINKYVKDEGKKKVANFLADMAGEGLEEYVSDVVGEYTQDIYKPYEGNKNVLERFVDTQPSALYSGLVGGLTAGVLNGVPVAIDNAFQGANPDLMRMIEGPNEPTKVINEDFLDKNKTPIQENVINKNLNNTNNTNTIQEQLQNVSQNITQNNLDLNQNDLMNTDITEDNATDVLDMLLERNNQNTVADNAKLNDISFNEQSNINTRENKNVAENVLNDAKNVKTIDEQLVKDLKSKDNVIKMESQRINEETILREGRAINYDENQLTKLAKMSNDIGVPIRVVESLDKGAEGKYDKGIIYISKNCQNPIQAVLKHELLHHISKTTNYKKLENTLIKLAEKKYGITEQEGINNRIRDYADRGVDLTYEEAREEYAAVIAQDLFSDIDSIEKFVQLDLNLAQKVYNWIKEKLYQVTGNEEKEYLMKAERLYRKAFEESKTTNNNNENYLIAKNTNGEELVIADKIPSNSNQVINKNIVYNYFKNYTKEYKIDSDGRLVNFNKASANEYAYSRYTKSLKQNYYIKKIKLSGNMDEVISIAKNGRFTPNNPPGKIHQNDPSIGKNGFYHYDVKFGTVLRDKKGNALSGTIYGAELVLENNADGKTYFYDLINIKKTTDTLDITSMPTINIVGNRVSSTNSSITQVNNKSSNNLQSNNNTINASNTNNTVNTTSSSNSNNSTNNNNNNSSNTTSNSVTSATSSTGYSLGSNIDNIKSQLDYQVNKDTAPMMESQRIINNILSEDISIDNKVSLLNDYSNEFDNKFVKTKFKRNIEALENGYNSAKEYSKFNEYVRSIKDFMEAEDALNEVKLNKNSLNDKQYAYELKELTDKYNELKKFDINSFDRKLVSNKEITNDQKIVSNNLGSIEYIYAGDDQINIYAVSKNGNLYDSSIYRIDDLAKKYGSTIANEIISNVDNTKKKITKFNNYDVYTNEMIDKIVKDAEKNFGTTNNPNEAGYLTINGKMLDFSDKKNGGQAGMRNEDHIAIKNMSDFMDMGNIRLQPETGGFELLKEPNDIQYKKLRSYLKNNTTANNSGVFIGFSKDKYSIGRNGDGFLSYDAPINVDQIINDVKAHYNRSSNMNYSLGTNLNRMNENAELKDRVAGWDSLEKRTVKKIIDLEQDTYKGTDLNKFVQEAAKEALRTGKVSDTTRNYILNELENNNYFAEDLYDGDYQRLMDFISNDKDIIIETKYKKDAKELLARYGAKGNTYNGIRVRFSDYDNAKGQFLDSIYNELRNQFPTLKEQYNPVDELEEVLKLVDEIKPEYQKTKVQEDIREYMKSEINDMMDVFENEVVYRSDKSAFDAYARKMKKENGIFNPTENIRKLLSKDAKDEIENIDLKVDDNKYKEVGNYVEFMRNYSNYNMSITNNNDIVANKNKNLREFLYKNTEEKVFKAGEEFADNKRRVTDRLYAAMKKYDIKPGSKESAAVQKLGEGKQQVWYDAEEVTGKKGAKTRAVVNYSLEDLAKEFPNKADQDRIIGMEKECRKIYDEYVDRHNAMLEMIYPEEELTYEKTKQKDAIMLEINRLKNNLELFKQAEKTPAMMAQINQTIKDIKNAEKRLNNVDANVKKNKRLEKRSNYYHHFKEMTRAENIKSIFTDNNQINIDNNLAGVSEFTRPKAKWQDYMQERSGDAEYTEDAINGLLKYIDQAEYSIAFDPVINDLREFNKAVVKYSNDAGINNSKYIEFLTDYTNDIAGKTNPYDRWLSKGTNGRKVLRVVKMLNNTAKANAVMGNLNSAVSQFYNLPNAISLLMKNGGSKSSIDLTKGSNDYTNYVRNKLTGKDISNEPITHSAFLKQRYMEDIDAKFDTSKFKFMKDAASKVMQLGDQAVAELTWYSAYEQGLRKNVESPISYADDITRRAVAGRGVGEVPLMQKSQIIKLLAPFQVEVTNQWNLMKQLVGEKNIGPLVGMFLTTSIMNIVNKAMTGRTVGFDPVDVVMDVINNAGDDDDKDDLFFDALGRVGGELLSNIPMGTNIATFALNDSQRTKLFGESDPTRYGTSNIGVQNFVKPVVDFATGNNVDYMNFIGNFVTPYGGKQLERAYKFAEDSGIIPRIDINRKDGIKINNNAGAYNDNGQLKYVIDNNPVNIAKGLAFGTYATNEGKEYIDNNYSALTANRTAAYEALVDEGINNSTAYNVIRDTTSFESMKDENGETIKNSRAAQVRKYLEDADLYDEVMNAGVYEELNLNKTIIGMTQSEFDEFYNSLMK